MKKIERLLAMIVLLLEKESITSSELAKKFAVTKRTIFRDIQTIEQAGFPITSSYGRNGGISLIDSFKLRTLSFTETEKQLILDALTMNEQLVGEALELSVLKEKVQLLAEHSSHDKTLSMSSPTVHRPSIEKYIFEINKQIRIAMNKKLKITISYVDSSGKFTTRTIAPHKLGFFNGSWFLRGYCELRQAFRFFKVTRIRTIFLTSETFLPKVDSQTDFVSSKEYKITVSFAKNELGRLFDYYLEDELEILENSVLIRFSACDLEEISNFLLRFHGNVTILEPDELKHKYSDILKKYRIN